MFGIQPEYIIDLENDNNLHGSDYRIAKVSIGSLISEKTLTEVLIKEELKKLLIESSHLFVLVINVTDAEANANVIKNIDWAKVFDGSNKYFIIEICQESTLLYRFICNEIKDFVNDEFNKNLNDYECDENESVDNYQDDFRSFIEKNCEQKSLLDCHINESDYYTYVNDAAQQNDCVLMRLLKLFVSRDYLNQDVLKSLVTTSSVQTLSAYLDLPLQDDDDGFSLFPSTSFIRMVVSQSKYEEGKTLLCMAAEKRDTDMVRVLLRLGADVESGDDKNQLPADYAMQAERYLNLKLLLENDAPVSYDKNFKLFSQSKANEKVEIFKILEDRNELHAAVRYNNKEKIRKFKTNNPNIKFAYLFTKAVFTTACEQKNFSDVCATLLTENFSINKSQVEMKMNDSVKQSITTYMQNKFKRKECWHILFLESNTKIGFMNDKTDYTENFKRITQIYERLHEHKEVDDLIKILEHSESFSITFDFRNKYVDKTDLMSGPGRDGLCYQNRGLIFVGAGRAASAADGNNDDDVTGVVAHELTHLALQIMFNNSCKPYFVHDLEQQNVYEKILSEIEALPDNIDVIKDVFKYKKQEKIKELIVRVPQLIALNKKELLEGKYPRLLKFFRDNVSKRAEVLVQNPETFRVQRGVQQLNDKLGHIEEMKKFKIQLNNSRVNHISHEKHYHIVTCPTTRLFLYDFYNQHNTIDVKAESHFIYASVQDLLIQLKLQQILRIWDLIDNITLVINCESLDTEDCEDYVKPFKNIKKRIAKRLIVFGSEKAISNFKKLQIDAKRNSDAHFIQYEWVDIHDDYKSTLMESEISFQGVDVRLSRIGCSFEIVPMEKVVNGEKMIIERSTVVNDHYDPDEFVNRNFENYEKFDQFLTDVMDNKALLLSGDAGIGKSIILTHISLQLKIIEETFYVIRVNLHEHIKAFLKTRLVNSKAALDFVTNNFLQCENNSDVEFTRKLFAYCLEHEKVILLFDAVDEIAPTCLNQCLKFLSYLSCQGKIRLWITTREHLCTQLSDTLEESPSFKQIYLEAFTMTNQKESLTKFWKKKLKLDRVEQKLLHFADKLTDGIYESIFEWSAATIGIPLLITMIAVIYLDDAEDYVNGDGSETKKFEINDLFGLFTAFITKKIHTMVKDKGEIVEKEKGENEIFGLDVIALHENLALRSMFQDTTMYGHLYRSRTYTTEIESIQRYGLVTFDVNKEPYFMHDTISEYFVATFISKTLKNFAKFSDFPIAKVQLAMVAMNRYAISTHNIEQYSLLNFVNGCFGIFFDEQMENAIIEKSYDHRLHSLNRENHKIIEFLADMIKKDAVYLSHFYFKYIIVTNDKNLLLEKLFHEDSDVFHQASRYCASYIIESFSSDERVNQRITKEFYFRKFVYFNAFQVAFLRFPEKETDLIRDCSNYNELKELQKKNPNEFLQKQPEELYQRSTLFHHIQIINKLKLNDDEIKSELMDAIDDFAYKYDVKYKYFCESSFRKAIEMKWMALQELVPGNCNNWQLLMTTLFQNVIECIFFHQENMVVIIEFYKFVKDKFPDEYANILEETFIDYMCRCESYAGTEKLFSFIREEVNLEEILTKNAIKISDSMETIFSMAGTSFLILQRCFTEKEFKFFLFHKIEGSEDNFVSKLFDNEAIDLFKFLDAIEESYVEMDEFKMSYKRAIDRLVNLLWKVIDDSRSDYYSCNSYALKKLTKIEKCVDNEVMKYAMQKSNPNGQSIFEVAAKQQDFSILRKVWCMAKNVLTNEELKDILTKDGSSFSM